MPADPEVMDKQVPPVRIIMQDGKLIDKKFDLRKLAPPPKDEKWGGPIGRWNQNG